MRATAWIIAAMAVLVASAWADGFDGRDAGTASGRGKHGGADCQDLRADISVEDDILSGVGRRFGTSGRGTLQDFTSAFEGTVDANGDAMVTVFRYKFAAKLAGGRFVATMVNNNCEYQLDFPRK